MKNLVLSVFVILLALPAWATDVVPVTAEPLEPLPGGDVMITGEGPAETVPGQEDTAMPAAPMPEGDDSAEAQANLVCQSYTMMTGVSGPDYVPGIDAYGRPVAPADVNSTQAFDVPERIDIPLDVDVLQTLGIVMQPDLDLKANVGSVAILKDGRVLYNDQDVSSEVNTYCAKPKLETNVKTVQ